MLVIFTVGLPDLASSCSIIARAACKEMPNAIGTARRAAPAIACTFSGTGARAPRRAAITITTS